VSFVICNNNIYYRLLSYSRLNKLFYTASAASLLANWLALTITFIKYWKLESHKWFPNLSRPGRLSANRDINASQTYLSGHRDIALYTGTDPIKPGRLVSLSCRSNGDNYIAPNKRLRRQCHSRPYWYASGCRIQAPYADLNRKKAPYADLNRKSRSVILIHICASSSSISWTLQIKTSDVVLDRPWPRGSSMTQICVPEPPNLAWPRVFRALAMTSRVQALASASRVLMALASSFGFWLNYN